MSKGKSFGLVFCGGGTCGSYQIGVWRALREAGLEQSIGGVSGSSVGALNVLLFAQGDIERAEAVWLSFRERDLLAPRGRMKGEGTGALFSQERIADVIDRAIYNWDAVHERADTFAGVSVIDEPLPAEKRLDHLRHEGGVAMYFPLTGRSPSEIKNIALASAAIPWIYPVRRVDGKRCIDGDFADKTPFLPLAEAGYERIIILHLNSLEEAADKRHEYKYDTALNGRVRLYHLFPEKTLGNYLWISERATRKRIERGYREGLRFLEEKGGELF